MTTKTTTPNIKVTAPEGSKNKSRLTKALEQISDALSGKKIYNF